MPQPEILLVDNYDSFTYNLAQLAGVAGAQVQVVRNDAQSLEDMRSRDHDLWIMSPGPGRPESAGVCIQLAQSSDPRPMLGVCLGMQAMYVAEGGSVVRSQQVVHGKTSPVAHRQAPLFHGLTSPFEAARYHSLKCDSKTKPQTLETIAWLEDTGQTDAGQEDMIMGFAHAEYPRYGVQFHPESIATEQGLQLMKNFLALA